MSKRTKAETRRADEVKFDAEAARAAREKALRAVFIEESHKVCGRCEECPHPRECEKCAFSADSNPIYEFIDGEDTFVDSWQLYDDNHAATKAPNWIVEGLVVEKRKGVIFGKAKAKKTWLALQLAESVATGHDFLGMKVPRPRRVVYLNMEVSASDMRWRAATMGKNFHLADLEDEYTFQVYNLRGRGAAVRANWLPLLQATYDADLVILDPRYKLLLPGEDENTAQGLRGFQTFVDRLAEFSTVVTVIHDGKGTAKGERGAGSYTTIADYDFAMAIDAAGKGDDENLKSLSFPPARSLPPRPPMEIRFDPVKFIFKPTSKNTGE